MKEALTKYGAVSTGGQYPVAMDATEIASVQKKKC